jgi:hypothetical protein
VRDTILLEEVRYPPGELLHDGGLLFHHRGEVELHALDVDAEGGKAMFGFVVLVRRLQERLAGDATDAQAGAAQTRLGLDTRHLQAQLRRTNGRNITARPRADDH